MHEHGSLNSFVKKNSIVLARGMQEGTKKCARKQSNRKTAANLIRFVCTWTAVGSSAGVNTAQVERAIYEIEIVYHAVSRIEIANIKSFRS